MPVQQYQTANLFLSLPAPSLSSFSSSCSTATAAAAWVASSSPDRPSGTSAELTAAESKLRVTLEPPTPLFFLRTYVCMDMDMSQQLCHVQ